LCVQSETASVSARLDPRESAEVVPLDRHRNAGAGLAREHLQHGFARLSVNVNARCRLERLRIRARRSVRDDAYVKLIALTLGRG
jgi:hypothetical protein